MQCKRSVAIWLSRQPEHPLFESVVGQNADVFANYHSKMVANVVSHVSTLWGGICPTARLAAHNLGNYPAIEAKKWYINTCVFMYRIPLFTLSPLFLLLVLHFWSCSPHKWCTCCRPQYGMGRVLTLCHPRFGHS